MALPSRKPVKDDYLKYYRVVRYYNQAKYNLTHAEIDMLLFLNSEMYFDSAKFDEFNELMSWDKKRFKKLLKEGWIDVFRKKQGNTRVVYCLSFKAKTMIRDIYKKLNGEEIPESPTSNPLFKRNVSYMDKVYRNFIKAMNKETRRLRRQPPE